MTDAAPPPPPAERGIVIGRPWGIPVVVARSWFLVAALITWVFQPSVARQLPELGPATWLVSLLFAVLLYASVLIHELGHAMTARRFGLPVHRITLHLLGGLTEIEDQRPAPGRSLLVSGAGPVLNLALAALSWLVLQTTAPGTVLYVLAFALTSTNLVVAVFNLLPGLPLDGGRMLEAAVWRVSGRRLAGALAAGWVGRGLAVLLVALPLLPVLRGQPPSLVFVLWGVLLGGFIWVGAGEGLAAARRRERLPRLTALGLARPVILVPGDLPVAEAVRRAGAERAGGVVVADHAGRPVGLADESAVRAMPEQRRPWVAIADVSRRLTEAQFLPADLAGESLLAALHRQPAPAYLLVEPGGRLRGLLVQADVERALDPRARSGSGPGR